MAENRTYDDAALAAEFAAKRQLQIEEDFVKPFDPDCILEVRHLRKCFPFFQKACIIYPILHFAQIITQFFGGIHKWKRKISKR